MKRILLPIVAHSLTSCIQPMTRQDQLNVYRKNCLDYGFQWGTREFAQCVNDQEYRDEKLAIERRKAQALENEAWGYSNSNSYSYGSTRSQGYAKPRKMKKHSYGAVYPSNDVYIDQRVNQKVNQKVKQKVQNTTNVHENHVHETHVHNTYNPEPVYIDRPVAPEPQSYIPPAPPAPSLSEVQGWVNEAQSTEQLPVGEIPPAPPFPADLTFGDN